MARSPGAKEITLKNEAAHFVLALIECIIDERTELQHLAAAFLDGKPIDPKGLVGRRQEVALAFYLQIESESGAVELPSSEPFEIAVMHARHRAVATEIAAKMRRRKGEKREIKRRVYEVLDDFLIVVLVATKVAGMATVLPSAASEADNDFSRLIQTLIDCSERCYVAIAKRRQLSTEVSQQIKLILSDLSGRKLNDRMRSIIRLFGQIDWKVHI